MSRLGLRLLVSLVLLGCGSSWANGPQRIVSLMPSLTEAVCSLGACDRLVGVDQHSDWPAQVNSLPRMGSGLQPNLERIVSLQPDLVLLSPYAAGVEQRLKALGLTVLVLDAQTLDQTRLLLVVLGQALDLEESAARERWQADWERLQSLQEAVPDSQRGARMYIEVDRSPYAAGEASFIGQIMTELGLVNVVGSEWGPFPRISPEFVVRSQADWIVVSAAEAGAVGARPGWHLLPAVQQQQICALAPESMNRLVRAGPRWIEGAQVLVDCLKGLNRGSVHAD